MFPIYLEEPETCEYLPSEEKQNIFFFSPNLTQAQVQLLITAGFRHFGNYWFKPGCPKCQKCRGIRIDCNAFTPSKSQRRLLRKNGDLTFSIENVANDKEHLDLVNLYHREQYKNFQWRYQQFTEQTYSESFLNNMSCAKEYQVRDENNTLQAVGIIDITQSVQSSIYFYYRPEMRKRSIGIWTILKEIELCKNEGRRWLHLGLYNEEARTLNYKGNFSPFELLPQRTVHENAEFALQILFKDTL